MRWAVRSCRRLLGHPTVLAIGALVWLLLRSGRKPSRLAYPCQRAALASSTLVLGLPLLHAIDRAHPLAGERSRAARLLPAGALVLALVLSAGPPEGSRPGVSARAAIDTSSRFADYRASVFAIENAGGPAGDHHLGVDELISCMHAGGLSFYRSGSGAPESAPEGIVGYDDVVLIKINQQWPERGGTNTDVLRGLIARIVEHPDGFTGEVVVVENTQGRGTFDWAESNAEDHSQSALDVVTDFADAGWPVSTYLWDAIRSTSVAEYTDGDLTDGYVVGEYDAIARIRVSYPKFRTAQGRYVSLKHGVFDPGSQTYSDDAFTFLNVPVLKCHGAVYGVTASVKHHVGTMTTQLSTNTHAAVRYGGLGRFLADVRRPDLNLVDAIYVLAHPSGGPWCSYEEATRLDRLVAGLDPVALDLWATAHILVPAIVDNGYTDYPMQDPDDPSSIFRIYLNATTAVLADAGVPVTNDLAYVDATTCTIIGAEPGSSSGSGIMGPVPNPTRGATTIPLLGATPGPTRVRIYDAAGRLVRTLVGNAGAGAGAGVRWDGRSDDGRPVPAGSYTYRVSGPPDDDGRVRDGTGKLVRVR